MIVTTPGTTMVILIANKATAQLMIMSIMARTKPCCEAIHVATKATAQLMIMFTTTKAKQIDVATFGNIMTIAIAQEKQTHLPTTITTIPPATTIATALEIAANTSIMV